MERDLKCMYCAESGITNTDVFIEIVDVELGAGWICKECFIESEKEKEEHLKELEQELQAKGQECEELKEQFKLAEPLYQACNIKDKKINKLKQTLTEIKEIVKPHQRNIDKICGHCRRYDGCHACCIDDINCYQYKKPTTPACDKYCELKEFEINNIANQILQKISEVEVDNV